MAEPVSIQPSRHWVRGRVGRIFAAQIAFGCVPGLFDLVLNNPPARTVWIDLLAGCLYSLSISCPCFLFIPPLEYRLHDRPLFVRLGVGLPIMLAATLGGCLIANTIIRALLPVEGGRWLDYYTSLRICLLITFTFGLGTYLLAMIDYRLMNARLELQKKELAEVQARFASLESRVHPHFLFNTLNTVAALSRRDPDQAEKVIERLGHLLRYSLDSEAEPVVPVSAELRVVREYLDIEKVRFGDRLRFQIHCDAASEGCTVPSLAIQTLAENSIKHGVGSSSGTVGIIVTVACHSGRLRITVADDGPGFDGSSAMKPGHGLDLLSRRLQGLFGSSARLEFPEPGRAVVAISLDARS